MKTGDTQNKPEDWPAWIRHQLIRRGIRDERVLTVFAKTPRSRFVPAGLRVLGNEDAPIPIGGQQTVSQPYIIALSLQALQLTGSERVLDLGTGSGFQAALLSQLAAEVHTIEIRSRLHSAARIALERFGADNIHLHFGDGSLGLPEYAPYDAIVVGSRASKVPASLTRQLAVGGRLVIPVGEEESQNLLLIEKHADDQLTRKIIERVRFVPLMGIDGSGRVPD